MYEYKANWVRVIDGDTVILNVDLGLHTFHVGTFRLLGINAPELKGPDHDKALESKSALEKILLEAGDLTITTHKADKYGRWLVMIKYKDSKGTEFSVNDIMVRGGFAKVMK